MRFTIPLRRFHTQISLFDMLIMKKISSMPLLHNTSILNNISPMGQFQGHSNVLFDQKNGYSGLVDLMDHLINDLRQKGGKLPPRWLVDEEKFWFGHHSSSNGQHLLFPSAQSPGCLFRSYSLRWGTVQRLGQKGLFFTLPPFSSKGSQFQILQNSHSGEGPLPSGIKLTPISTLLSISAFSDCQALQT